MSDVLCTALCGIRGCRGCLFLCRFSPPVLQTLQYVLKKPEAVMFKR